MKFESKIKYELAKIYFGCGRMNEALNRLERIQKREKNPGNDFYNILGECYLQVGDKYNAQTAWEKSLDLNYQQWDILKKYRRVSAELIEDEKKRRIASPDVERLFLRHVPKELAPKKRGMNICLFNEWNIGNNLTMLMHAINRYTIHKARCITLRNSFINYQHDILMENAPESVEEAEAIVRHADFYHIGRDYKDFGNVHFRNYLNPNNCVFQYFGSYGRRFGRRIAQMHKETGFHAIVWPDWTIWHQLPFYYHVMKMFDAESVPRCEKPEDVIRISHAPTDREVKDTDLFLEVIGELKKKYAVEEVLIENVSYQESLKMKKTAQMNFDQLLIGMYGGSTIESMAMGQVAFCGLNNFFMSNYPSCPVENVTPKTLKARIEYYLRNREEIDQKGEEGRQWVNRIHSPKKIVRQYVYIYDLIRHGPRNIEDHEEFFIQDT